MAVPSIRASFLHSNFEALATLGPIAVRRVRARLPEQVIGDAEGATKVAWLPVEYDVLLTEAVEAELGPRVMHDWTREGVLRSTNTPLLSPLVRSARAIFGLSPHGFLKRAPHGFGTLYRHCGAMSYADAGERTAAITWGELPDAIVRSDAYCRAIAAALEAILVLAGEPEGRVEASRQSDARARTFTCAW